MPTLSSRVVSALFIIAVCAAVILALPGTAHAQSLPDAIGNNSWLGFGLALGVSALGRRALKK